MGFAYVRLYPSLATVAALPTRGCSTHLGLLRALPAFGITSPPHLLAWGASVDLIASGLCGMT